MYILELNSKISAGIRSEVHDLIHFSWSFESEESRDVEMLVYPGQDVKDPLDEMSTHILVRNDHDKLIGYGRVAIIHKNSMLPGNLTEIQGLCTTYPFAYISRLVVHPEYRGRGVAWAIHRARLDVAAQRGAKEVYGWAVGDKPRSSLAQMGFEELRVREGFETGWYRTSRTTRLVKFNIAPAANERLLELKLGSY